MKTLLTIFTLVFTVMFSSTSFSGWTKVSEDFDGGSTFYVDFERIRKVGGYVYYWQMTDYLKPKNGYFSSKFYIQGDCKLFRMKDVSALFYKEPMGKGPGLDVEIQGKYGNWKYPPPNTAGEEILKLVCGQ